VDGFRDVTVPDADRLWLGVGATYRHSRAFDVDVAFTHLFFRDTSTAATRSFYQGLASATVRGSVATTVDTVALDLHWRF
jgi:long-chain fatty acid transport protein